MKRLIPLFIGLLLIGVLVLVNHGIGKTTKPDNDDDDSQTQSSQQDSIKSRTCAPPPRRTVN